MTGELPNDAIVVEAQLGRVARTPWRVAARCVYGFPQVIASPSVLSDGTRFPNLVWLTCPWLTDRVSALESEGEIARWARRAAADEDLADRLRAVDVELRQARAAEAPGEDPCATVGLAGQRDPLGVKCLHAHVALAMAGFADPVGQDVLGKIGTACPEIRCARLAESEG